MTGRCYMLLYCLKWLSCACSLRRYTSPDFLYIRSWLPCIFFAGVITMGNIGRQLALVRSWSHGRKLTRTLLNECLINAGFVQVVLNVDSADVCLKVFPALVFFFFSMNISSFRKRPIRTDGSLGHLHAASTRTGWSRMSRSGTSDESRAPDWLLSAGLNSIFDWLSVRPPAAVGPEPKGRREQSLLCFFLRCSLSLLTWKGISGEASIVLQISSNV